MTTTNGTPKRTLRSRRVLTPSGLRPADVVLSGERIERLEEWGVQSGSGVEDLGDLVLMAGIVDVHVHVNEPGRSHWEGFECATRAAAAGGTTTLVDMPLNSSPVTTSVAALEAKMNSSSGKCWVDVGFHGGVVPDNAQDPEVLDSLAGSGVLAMKAFLCDSGLDDFPPVDRAALEVAMPVLGRRGLPLLVHSEVFGSSPVPASSSYASHLASRPQECEVRAIELMIELCRATGCAVHIVHLSAAEALPVIASARREGLRLSVETCPHYLFFCAEEIADGDARFKCAPPIREEANREALWRGLDEGLIDMIASDHSPCPPSLKALDRGDFAAAWGGIASLQLTLPAVWTEARRRGVSLEVLADWLCVRPARLLGLVDRGRLAAGGLANLTAWDPDVEILVEGEKLFHRHPLTPYSGRRLRGLVQQTWLRGEVVFREGELVGEPRGRLVLRNVGHDESAGGSS